MISKRTGTLHFYPTFTLVFKLPVLIAVHFSCISDGIRHSPRLAGEEPLYNYDILLTCGVKNNQACGKIVTIHDESARDTLKEIKRMIRGKVPNSSTRAGLYWNPPKGKQCVILENDKDLEKAKREHVVKGEVKNLKLTVCTIQTEIGGKGRSMKTKLDLQAPSSSVKPETMRSKSSEDSESEDEDRCMTYLKNEASKPDQKKKDGNSIPLGMVDADYYNRMGCCDRVHA